METTNLRHYYPTTADFQTSLICSDLSDVFDDFSFFVALSDRRVMQKPFGETP